MLYEKSVKNFKRIPRCRIEGCDDGFICTLVLGNNTGKYKFLSMFQCCIYFQAQ